MRIMKTCNLAALCLLFLFSFAGNVFAAPQTTCPVMGGKINTKIYADHEGKRVYFCCEACPAQFKKDPKKYLAKLKEMDQEPEEIKQTDKDKESKEAEQPEKEKADKDEHK